MVMRQSTWLPTMAGIPAGISNILLPSPKLSIIDFIHYPTSLTNSADSQPHQHYFWGPRVQSQMNT